MTFRKIHQNLRFCKKFYFQKITMLDEANGWLETSKNLETHQGIPIVKLDMEFSPEVFNVWHQSLFTKNLES